MMTTNPVVTLSMKMKNSTEMLTGAVSGLSIPADRTGYERRQQFLRV